MFIIKKIPDKDGRYFIKSVNNSILSDDYVWWPDNLNKNIFYQYKGFILPTIKRGTVASYIPNEEAYKAWLETKSETDINISDHEILEILLGVEDNNE